MMQRICPVCDQVMKHAHYCSACHSWVKDPVYMNVTYYLNERHPKNEAQCSYHNAEEEHTNAGAERRKAVRSSSGRERSVKTERRSELQKKARQGSRRRLSKRKIRFEN